MSKLASQNLQFLPRFMALAALTAMVAQSICIAPHALQLGIAAGQAETAPRANTTNSKLIPFLLASIRESNPEQQLALLAKAREELKKEGLAPEDVARILALIESLEQKARTRLSGGQSQAPASAPAQLAGDLPIIASLGAMAGSNASANSATKEGLSAKDIEKTLAANPEVRDALYEIGRSRLSRDARNLDLIVQDRTGKTPEELDADEAKARAEAYQAGPFLTLLTSVGLAKVDFTEENRQLRQEFEGVSTDELADLLIKNTLIYSAGAGALKGVINDYGPRALGVSAEVLTTFILNSRLVLRLANLYGIELADVEKQIFLFSVFIAAKAGAQYGDGASLTEMFKSFGRRLGNFKFGGDEKSFVGMLEKLVSNPKLAKYIPPIVGQKIAGTTPAGPATPAAPSAPGTAAPPTNPPAPATPSAPPEPPTRAAKLKSIASRFKLMTLVQSGYFAALSAGESFVIGKTAKSILVGMHDSKRAIHNENFRRFLMTPTAEGFFKLLTLASFDGRPTKAKLEFIVNVARSARSCSPEDLARMKADPAAAYACFGNINTDRFERLRAEMLTFDEIPQEYVADLRAVPRQNRLRMAELILQMQFLDGDRSPSETQFFRGVVTKALGVETLEDLRYFDRLHAYIQENGGMERSPRTPTGFTIRSRVSAIPYDMNRGYLPINAPEEPADPRPTTATSTPAVPPAKPANTPKPTNTAKPAEAAKP